MPELPEVETVCRALRRLAMGADVTRIAHLREDYAAAGYELLPRFRPGAIGDVERRGKFFALHLSSGFTLLLHLGMSGRLLMMPSGDPGDGHTHARLELGGGRGSLHLRDPRRFGLFALFENGGLAEYPSWRNLGIDPFAMKPSMLAAMLEGRRKPVKNFLLDQRFIAGLGNIYADESLHRAKIHPGREAGSLGPAEIKRLCRGIREVLNAAIESGGTSTSDYRKLDGTLGSFQNVLRVYKRHGLPCPRCGTEVARTVFSARGTHFCPKCQV